MREQRGFTLIEMMITVAIIAVLALIAVPAYFSQSRKSKASSETAAMFAELSTKEEQYKIENAAYLPAAECPATPSSSGQSLSGCLAGSAWTNLHVNPPETKAYCTYAVTTGSAGDNPTAGSPAIPTGLHMASDGTNPTPISSWFYVVGHCDMDGSTTTDSYYFMSSMDTKIQSLNEGK